MSKLKYVSIGLPKDLVEEMKVWKTAFSLAYGRTMSYGEILRGMFDSLQTSDPAVVEELDGMVKMHPELMDKLAKYQKDFPQE